MNWPETIRRFRRVRGLKQAALADLLNVDQSTISRWEQGRDTPNLGAQRILRRFITSPMSHDRDGWLRLLVRKAGFSAVLDRGLRVRESSDDLLSALALQRADVLERRVFDVGVDGLECLQAVKDDGFFDGATGVCVTAATMITRRAAFEAFVDLFPVVTGGSDTLMLIHCRPGDA
ncbi:MAG: helix-turn-helix domain-containing protein, partial [Caulobacterales bacterium]|nr:helix-turn-helix domain-containing protein [Caulobacterales bacterium]